LKKALMLLLFNTEKQRVPPTGATLSPRLPSLPERSSLMCPIQELIECSEMLTLGPVFMQK